MDIYVRKGCDGYSVSEHRDGALAKILPPSVIEDGKETTLSLTKSALNEYEYESDSYKATMSITGLGNGLFSVKRSFYNATDKTKRIQTVFKVSAEFKVEKYLIPCVSINGNEFGKGLEPKGLTRDGKDWIFGYDRVSVPSCTLTECESAALSIFASADDKSSLESSCSISKYADTYIQKIIHPKVEGPIRYSTRDGYGEPIDDYITLAPGECFEYTVYVLVSTPRWKNFGIADTLDAAITLFPEKVTPRVASSKEVWENSIAFARSLVSDYNGKRGFIIGFLPEPDGSFAYRKDNCFELAWCGQNILFSRMFILDYILNGNKENLDTALEILDTRVKYCVADNGLLASQLKHCDNLYANASDTCNMGYGAYEFLRVYKTLSDIGIDKPEYLNAGLGLCDFFLEHFNEGFGFGKKWRHDGVCLDEGGTIGAFVIPALAKAYELTREEKYLSLAERSMEYYVNRDLKNFICTAGALDTCCVDKETSAPFIMSSVLLYELTGKSVYLEYGKMAAYYFTSWMYHYHPCYENDTDISKYGVTMRGLTAVSTQHHHVDMYAGIVVPYLIRLSELTGDESFAIRADMMWRAVLQGISDGNLTMHGRLRPRGSQNEAIFHCSWAFGNGKRGDLNDWLVAWPCAFRLSALAEEFKREKLL